MVVYRRTFLEKLIYIFTVNLEWVCPSSILIYEFHLVSLTKCYSNQPGFYLVCERTISQILISNVWIYHILHKICCFAVSKMDLRHLWQCTVHEKHMRVDEFIFRESTWGFASAFKNTRLLLFSLGSCQLRKLVIYQWAEWRG